jgi:hypothetical protein
MIPKGYICRYKFKIEDNQERSKLVQIEIQESLNTLVGIEI